MRGFLWIVLAIVLIVILTAVFFVLSVRVRGVSAPQQQGPPSAGNGELREIADSGPLRIADEPPPPLDIVHPVWPSPDLTLTADRIHLPTPAVEIPEPVATHDEGLLEPSPPSIPSLSGLVPDPEAGFANHLLAQRQKGLDLSMIVDGEPAANVDLRRVRNSVRLLSVLFPRARVGAILYNSPQSQWTVLGASAEQLHRALSPEDGSGAKPPGDLMNLDRATALAVKYPWSPNRRAVILLISGTQPWIGELPAVLNAIRAFKNRESAEIHLIQLPAAAAEEELSGFDRLCAGDVVARRVLKHEESLEVEMLATIVGREYRPEIKRIADELEE